MRNVKKRGKNMALDKVLIVDDDKNICDLLRLYLEKEGYSVILSHDGEEAVVKFNALKPDIVLLDVMLPGLDGWQVCREIRKKSNIPILMITAKSEPVFGGVYKLTAAENEKGEIIPKIKCSENVEKITIPQIGRAHV